jgi:transposase
MAAPEKPVRPEPNPSCPGCVERDRILDQHEQRISDLEKRLNELEKKLRRDRRQANPFSRDKRKANPKKPGRRKGKGRFSHRKPPPESEINNIDVPAGGCPCCGGDLTDLQTHEQVQSDLPVVKPTHTRFRWQSGWCGRCEQRVHVRHPSQVSTATGAAGVVVGPNAKSMASDMKHRMGVPWEKISDHLETHFNLPVTASALCQADMRLAEKLRPVYRELIDALRKCCSAVHADETGWRINALSAWLWVFTNRETTVYVIDASRGHEVVVEILGKDFKGVLVSDCFLAYDHNELDEWLKQKCFAHFLSELSEMEESKTRGAVRFPRALTAILRKALELRDAKPTLTKRTFTRRFNAIGRSLDALIAEDRQLTDDDNRRFAKRLRKQRDHLFTFLTHEGIDATNNRAERTLRYAVGIRKTGGCNKTTRGAEAHAIVGSVAVTAKQRGVPPAAYLASVLTAPHQPPSLPSG